MPGISPYRRCTGLTFSHLLRYASESRKYVRLFRFPDASRAGDSLISTIKNSPSLRSELFFIVEMPGISPYRRCTGLTFSHLLRYASESRKYVRLFRFPDASRAGDSLISTIKNSPSLRSELFFIVEMPGIEPGCK